MPSRKIRVVVAIAAVLLAERAEAQRREGDAAPVALQLQLSEAVQFGAIVIPARAYRLNLTNEGLAFADADTMVLVATVPIVMSESAERVDKPSVAAKKTGKKIELVLKIANQRGRLEGVLAKGDADEASVTLAGKAEQAVASENPEVQSERATVEQAVALYFSGIKHCADKAHKSRWTTDDPRFVKCLCPVLLKWRLPKVKAPLRIDYPLAKGRTGFSFTATPDGKPTECRVWTGVAPPIPVPDAVPAVDPAAQPSDVVPAVESPLPTP